jgi:hypothetical protein
VQHEKLLEIQAAILCQEVGSRNQAENMPVKYALINKDG